jgi:hypothetical protein
MEVRTLLALFGTGLIAACTTTTPPDPRQRPQHDDCPALSALVANVYAAAWLPADFYHDDAAFAYYENSISVTPLAERGNRWVELCTDDAAQANAWSDADNSSARPLVSKRETEKFFEFVRPYDFRSRVHKCSYVDRSKYDRMGPITPATILGTLGGRPLSADAARQAVQYLVWVDNVQESAWTKILRTSGSATSTAYVEEFDAANITTGDVGLRDHITIRHIVYTVDIGSAEIHIANDSVIAEEDGRCH